MHYYLLEHRNQYAPVHPDGQYWGYPNTLTPRAIVIHAAESGPDEEMPDQTAESVAKYLANVERHASAHAVMDCDSTVELLPPTHQALHSIDAWKDSLGIEIAYRAHLWGTRPAYERMLLVNAATWCRRMAQTYRINPVKITREEYYAGKTGFIGHGYPGGVDLRLEGGNYRRTDPGKNFPWEIFLSLVKGDNEVWQHGDPHQLVLDTKDARAAMYNMGEGEYWERLVKAKVPEAQLIVEGRWAALFQEHYAHIMQIKSHLGLG